jgi:hypothetical protein
MRKHPYIILLAACLITAASSMAQSEQAAQTKYRKFAVYAGAGPSYFFNNLVTAKDHVNSLGYAISARFMWEPQHSFVSLGFETGYNRLYTVNATQGNTSAHISNTIIPLLFVVSMKFSPKIYADWSMGQGVLLNKAEATGFTGNYNSTAVSLGDFSATIGYRFIQKERISYAAELKGYYSSGYANGTVAALFIVGYRL